MPESPDAQGSGYVTAWACSILAGIWIVAGIATEIQGWGDRKPGGWAVELGEMLGALLPPVILSITAIASSKDRPKGRLGFLPMTLCAVFVAMRLIGLLA